MRASFFFRLFVLGAALAFVVLGLALPGGRTYPVSAQLADPTPQVPQTLCGDNIIYGTSFGGQAGVPFGIFQINTSTGGVIFVQALNNAWSLAVADSTHLYVSDFPNRTLFKDDLTTLTAPPSAGISSMDEVGMSEGGNGTLYDCDAAGQLHSDIPQGPDLRGIGKIAGVDVVYKGDLVLDQNCRLLSSVEDVGNSTWVRVSRSNGAVKVLNNVGVAATFGLGFNGSWQLWDDVSGFGGAGIQRLNPATGVPTGGTLNTVFNGVNVKWADLATNPCNVCNGDVEPDLGDAPDSTNHYSTNMTAYPTVTASFPTVFDILTGAPRGPKHWHASEDAWLGDDVTRETEADSGADSDSVWNIDPPTDDPDNDLDDDGMPATVSLPHCQTTSFTYSMTVATSTATRYTNVWFDFNRDGDWEDTLECVNGEEQTIHVEEWAVQDQVTTLGNGSHNVTTPIFNVYDPNYNHEDLWMRITLSDGVAEDIDGRGPGGGFEFGETEDYFLGPTGSDSEYRW